MRTKRINHLSLELRARRWEDQKIYIFSNRRAAENKLDLRASQSGSFLIARDAFPERESCSSVLPSLNVFVLAPFQSICIFEPFCKRLALRKWKKNRKQASNWIARVIHRLHLARMRLWVLQMTLAAYRGNHRENICLHLRKFFLIYF